MEVVDKVASSPWRQGLTGGLPSSLALPRSNGRLSVRTLPGLTGAPVAVFDSAARPQGPLRILVLKLDHLGDFLIGIPALQQLRDLFPDAHITLVCGPWNVAVAEDIAAADEIRAYEYFPKNAQDWDAKLPEDAIARFRESCAGKFDVAIDLRVDEDTRALLRHVDAALRCGIGSRRRQPGLDIILPSEFDGREVHPSGTESVTLGPQAFESRMPVRTHFYHEMDFSFTDNHLIYGPYCTLPLGKLRAELAFQLFGSIVSRPRVNVTVEVARDDSANVVATNRLHHLRKSIVSQLDVTFINDNPQARYEFRVSVDGQPKGSRLRFLGVRVEVLEGPPQGARFLPAELHSGESLSLLVRLVAERVRPLYPSGLHTLLAGGRDVGPIRPSGLSTAAKCVVVAPLSNSRLRNWPLDRYAAFIAMLLEKIECYVVLAGSAEQRDDLRVMRDRLDKDRRVVDLVGRTDWAGLAAIVGQADLVVANNSGIVHLAAACGTPTLAIYSGSHQPQEWGPRGDCVRTLMAAVPCSPCGHDKLEACAYGHECMTSIRPEAVLHHAMEMLDRGASPVKTAEPNPAGHGR